MTCSEFTAFLARSFQNLAEFSLDGSIHLICMDWRHMRDCLGQGQWRNGHFLPLPARAGVRLQERHGTHINSFELGQHGRYRTNVWQYKGVNTLKTGRMDELALHPTVKPVQMIADAIKDVSARGEIVLDLFGGSGSTLIAAHKTGRRARICEFDPIYCDRIIRRWEMYAKDDAEQIACGVVQRRSTLEAAE